MRRDNVANGKGCRCFINNGYQGNINIKTVNGTSLIGSGDYNIDVEKIIL